VTVALTVTATDMADALAIAWDAFRGAAGDDLTGWEVAAAAAEVHPQPAVRDTATQIHEVIKVTGNLVMITGAHAWHTLPDHGQHILRCLYQLLTESRKFHGDELAVILAGRADPLREMLHTSPALAARFPAIIDFPGYTPAQLTAILHALAAEAGLTLTPDATRKATTVLAYAENGHATGNARIAVQLLTQATASQAHRVTTGPEPSDPAVLATINAADIPEHLPPRNPPAHDQLPGQYL
jgi:hypothetical protein